MNWIENKWMRAAVPALLIHCSIGTVYCWSTFKEAIAQHIGMSTFSVGWAFSLAIFFLGMSAAFAGRMVERDIHRSSLVSCICFTAGMLGTGLCIQFATGVAALVGIFICYGCIMGIGLGIGYLTPVKTLMLWFEGQKGLATGISIMGFGLAKAIATPIMELIQNKLGIAQMFYILGGPLPAPEAPGLGGARGQGQQLPAAGDVPGQGLSGHLAHVLPEHPLRPGPDHL